MDSWGLNCLGGDVIDLQQRGLNLDIDLNYPIQTPLDLSLGLYSYPNTQELVVPNQVHRWPQQQISNALEAVDNEVSIISPQDFAQAIENSERNRSRVRHEFMGQAAITLKGCDDEANVCSNCKRNMHGGCQPCKPGASSKNKAENVCMIQEQPHLASLPEEPIFSCPICIGPLTEPTSTKCGHIFCKECLLRSLKSLHNKCPTCRQKVGKRSIIRVYLPTTC